jgi:hypothetical protein
MEDEDVLAHCVTDYWAWVCTDQRILKYKKGRGTAEELHDLSFDEISSISLVNKGRKDKLGGYGIFTIIIGLIIVVAEPAFAIISLILLIIGSYLVYRWLNSERAYFEFRGSGMLQNSGNDWKINQMAADDPDEVTEFVRTVRSRL